MDVSPVASTDPILVLSSFIANGAFLLRLLWKMVKGKPSTEDND